MPPLYEVTNLTLQHGDTFLLDIPRLTIRKGVSVGLVGPNGSGKSTLLRILAFLESAYRGMVYFNGARVARNDTPFMKKVTFLPQEPYLLKRSVFENVAYGPKLQGRKQNLKERVYRALELVGLPPKNFIRRRWFELSGGEAQRLALASRLALEPEVLILDEPTSSVDQKSAFMMKDAIKKIRKNHNTDLLIASHDLIWLNSVCDEVMRMWDGRIIGSGTDNLLSGPWEPDRNGLWVRILPDGQKIRTLAPPDPHALALLNPSHIMLSTEQPDHLSAQNILRGNITHMMVETDSEKVRVDIEVAGIPFTCSVTHHAADTLGLLPGKDIWVVFKASSLQWH